jgi:hypothetical protein
MRNLSIVEAAPKFNSAPKAAEPRMDDSAESHVFGAAEFAMHRIE